MTDEPYSPALAIGQVGAQALGARGQQRGHSEGQLSQEGVLAQVVDGQLLGVVVHLHAHLKDHTISKPASAHRYLTDQDRAAVAYLLIDLEHVVHCDRRSPDRVGLIHDHGLQQNNER